MTVRIDGKELERLFGYIARGLAWHHWNVLFTAASRVGGIRRWARANTVRGPPVFGSETEGGWQLWRRSLGLGGQAKECSELTVWRMSVSHQ